MSELTPCDYCTLRDIRNRNADKDIELHIEDSWTACYVDGKAGGQLLGTDRRLCMLRRKNDRGNR